MMSAYGPPQSMHTNRFEKFAGDCTCARILADCAGGSGGALLTIIWLTSR